MESPSNDQNALTCCSTGCLFFLLLPLIKIWPNFFYTALVVIIIINVSLYFKSLVEAKNNRLKKEDKEFASAFPYVADKYQSLIAELNQRQQKFDNIKKCVIDLYQKDKELNIKLIDFCNEEEKYGKLVHELKYSLSIADKENKNNISDQHLKIAMDKYSKIKKSTEEIRKAISETAQDFLNIKSELILNDSDYNKVSEKAISLLKTKIKELTAVQNNITYVD